MPCIKLENPKNTYMTLQTIDDILDGLQVALCGHSSGQEGGHPSRHSVQHVTPLLYYNIVSQRVRIIVSRRGV
jgi:hypothetical protein